MGQSWWERPSVLVPAAIAGVSPLLPFGVSSRPVYLVDGPSVTDTGAAIESGFEVLAGYQSVAVLVTAVASIVFSLVSPTRAWRAAAVIGVVACVVALVAITGHGVQVGSGLLFVAGAALVVRFAREFADTQAKPVFAVAMLMVLGLAIPLPAMGSDTGPVQHVAVGRFDQSTRLVPVAGDVAVATAGEVSVVEDDRLVPVVRIEDPRVTVLGIVRDRLVYFRADAFEVRIVPLTGGQPAVVTDVIGVDSMTMTGRVLLRTAGVTTPTLRRLDVTAARGRSNADVLDPARVPNTRPLLETDDEYLPTRFQEQPLTSQIAAIDNNELNRAVLVGAEPGARQWQRLTGEGGHRDCFGDVPAASPLDTADALTPDHGDGWWLHAGGRATLVHVGGDGYVRSTTDTPGLPVPHALMAAPDGSLYLAADDGLWRVPNPDSLLERPWKAKNCVPYPTVADPVRLEPVDGEQPAADTVPDGSGGTWRLAYEAGSYHLVHRDSWGGLLGHQAASAIGGQLSVDLSGGEPFVGRCPPTRLVDGQPAAPAQIPVTNANKCWDGLVIARDGRGWAVVDGKLYSFGPAGVAELTHGGALAAPVAVRLAAGEPVDAVPLWLPSLALDAAGRPLILVDDLLFSLSDQGKPVVLGQDDRLRDMTLVTVDDGVLARSRDGTLHRLGY